MCGESTCTHNNTYIACAICKELIQIKDTSALEGMGLVNILHGKRVYDKTTFRVCNKCKNKFKDEYSTN